MFIRTYRSYQLSNLYDLVRIETGCRFIQYQHLRIVKKCLCQPNSLAISLRQHFDLLVLLDGESATIHSFGNPAFQFDTMNSIHFTYKMKELMNIHIEVKRIVLRQIPDRFSDGTLPRNFLVADRYRPFRWRKIAGHDLH